MSMSESGSAPDLDDPGSAISKSETLQKTDWRRRWRDMPPAPWREYDDVDRAVDEDICGLDLTVDEQDAIRCQLGRLRCLASEYQRWAERAGTLLGSIDAGRELPEGEAAVRIDASKAGTDAGETGIATEEEAQHATGKGRPESAADPVTGAVRVSAGCDPRDAGPEAGTSTKAMDWLRDKYRRRAVDLANRLFDEAMGLFCGGAEYVDDEGFPPSWTLDVQLAVAATAVAFALASAEGHENPEEAARREWSDTWDFSSGENEDDLSRAAWHHALCIAERLLHDDTTNGDSGPQPKEVSR